MKTKVLSIVVVFSICLSLLAAAAPPLRSQVRAAGDFNTAPVANDDAYATDEDFALVIVAPGVLANDTDDDSDPLTAAKVSNPSHGTAILSSDGSFTYTPEADYNGRDSFTYKANDGQADSCLATVIVIVNPVNDPPVAVDDSASAHENHPVTIDVLANDSDIDGDALEVAIAANGSHGLVWNNGTNVTYIPEANYTGTDSFIYAASDGQTLSSFATVTIEVRSGNDAPIADGQAVSTDEDTVVAITLTASDADGDPLTYAVVSGPAHGILTGTAPNLTYTPSANYHGPDGLTFVANDGLLDSELATVAITVNPVNDAPVADGQAISTEEDTAVAITLTGADVDGDPLAYSIVTAPAHGTLTGSGASLTYTPDANCNGLDSFTFIANDGLLDSNVAVVTITINAVNDPPVAVDDTATTNEDTPIALDVLANDTDIEGDTLTVYLDHGPEHGTVVNTEGNYMTYTPDENYNGLDGFTYAVSDGQALSNLATVIIYVTPVNDPPNARGDWYHTKPNTPLTISAPGVLGNDTDVDGDLLTVVSNTQPTNGMLEMAADGSFTYTPHAGFKGTDIFTYTVTDSQGGTALAIVSLEVHSNRPPVARNDSYLVKRDTPLVIGIPGVLGNDDDPDSDPLVVLGFTQPSHGSVVMAADGSFTYTPDAGFIGTDTFTYTVSDGDGGTASAAVNVNVQPNRQPVANNDSYPMRANGGLKVGAPGVLGNDSDPDGDPLVVLSYSQPASGSVVMAADGSFTYTPDAGFIGTDVFTYTVSDGSGGTASATVDIDVHANGKPQAIDDSYITGVMTALIVDPPGVLANDNDPDNDRLTVTGCTQPDNGVVEMAEDGSFTYTPNMLFFGVDTFTYTVSDDWGGSDEGSVFIHVGPNEEPSASNDSYQTDMNTPLSIGAPGVLGNDGDPDGDPLWLLGHTDPANGVLEIAEDGSFTYTPNAEFAGTDTFSYTISDGLGGTASATVTIRVFSNAQPEAVDDSYFVAVFTSLVVEAPGVLANDADPDGDPLTVAWWTMPTNGTLEMAEDGSFSYTPNMFFLGVDTFNYTVSDGRGGTDTASVTIVTGINNSPEAKDDLYPGRLNVHLVVAAPGVLRNDDDPDGDPLVVSGYAQPSNGVLSMAGDGSFTYTPGTDFLGTDTFTYVVSDGKGGTDTGSVTIEVAPNSLPVAYDDTYHDGVGSTLSVTTDRGVLSNDADADGDPLTVADYSQPENGQVMAFPDGSFIYTPYSADFEGIDTFAYILTDGWGGMNEGTVIINVSPNLAPHAYDDEYPRDPNESLTVPAPGVLANDSDPDGDPLIVLSYTQPANGQLVVSEDGSFIYTPTSEADLDDSFSYTISDGFGGTALAIVNIVVCVNTPPVAYDQTVIAAEDTDQEITLTAYDLHGDPLTYTVWNGPSHGRLTGTGQTLIYTPAENYNGADSFTFKVNDGEYDSNLATVSITVNPVDDAPMALTGSVSTDEDTEVPVTLTGWDVDRDPLTFIVVEGPTQGALSGAAPNLVYTPDPDCNGVDSFSFVVNDGHLDSNPASLFVFILEVNDVPSFIRGSDQTVLEDAGAQTVMGWATDISTGPPNESSQALSFTVSNNNNGLFSVQPAIGPDGTLTYTPTLNANGSATVTVWIHDDGGTDNGGVDTSEPQTFTITVNAVNDAPSFTKGTDQSMLEDCGPQTVSGWATNISAGPPDESSQVLNFIVSNNNNALFSTQPAIASDGTLTYTPAANGNGKAIVTVSLHDNGGTSNGGVDASGTQTLAITVNLVNDAPVAADDSYSIDQNTSLSVPASGVLGNDTDVDSPSLTAVLQTTVSHGSLILSADGSFTYTPAPNFVGTDSFTYRAYDGDDSSNTAAVAITVKSVANAPIVTRVTPNEGAQGQTVTVTITGSNVRGATLVSFGPGITVNSLKVNKTTQVTATIAIDALADLGPRNVSVTTLAGTGILVNGFTVVLGPPTLSGVNPNQGTRGQTLDVTITGTNFVGVTAVSFGSGITVKSFNVTSSTQIVASITISSKAKPGTSDVSVTTSSGTGTLRRGFVVV